MELDDIERPQIRKAIKECDFLGPDHFRKKYGFGRAISNFLVYAGKTYDSKAIVGVAYKFIPRSPGPLGPNDFHGGVPVRRLLANLEFTVIVDRLSQEPIKAEMADDEPFDPSDIKDARERVQRSIVQRRGQKDFRDALIDAYGAQCAISECKILAVLEAAHIFPYLGERTNHVANGLLLRADLHTLFDCLLIAIDPSTNEVAVASSLRGSEYAEYQGRKLRGTLLDVQSPNKQALAQQWKAFRHADHQP